MKKTFKNSKGITLVALVITIIILLILAGISISALTNTGIFQKAKDAKQKSENAALDQNTKLDEYENEIDKYIPKANSLAKAVKVGDYVAYKPDDKLDKSALDKLKENLNTYSGARNLKTYSAIGRDNLSLRVIDGDEKTGAVRLISATPTSNNTTNSAIGRDNLDWRVLDVDEKTGAVRLISATPTDKTIVLYGYNGYNNAVKLLDDVCSTLYNSKLATKVQNLKIEDIQDKMKTDYTTIDSNYGNRFTPNNKYYPSILTKEKEQKITVGQNTTTGTELDFSEQKTFENQTESKQADTLDLKYTEWYKTMSANDFDGENKEMYYKLFINNGSNYPTYWMSSRCVIAYSSNASFYVRYVSSGYVGAYYLYRSDDREASFAYAFRPVITLNSNVQVTSGNGTESTPFEIK